MSVEPGHIDLLAQAATSLISSDVRRASAVAQIAEILSVLNALHIKALSTIAQFNKSHPDALGLTSYARKLVTA